MPGESAMNEAQLNSTGQLSPGQLLAEAPRTLTMAGDWHADRRWAAQVVRSAAAAGSRVLLHLGDFGIWPGPAGRQYLDTVEQVLAETGVTLAFIDGNHEDFPQLLSHPLDPESGLRVVRPGLYHLPRGTRWQWDQLSWLAVGGASSVDRAWRRPGISWWPEETLTAGDVARAGSGGQVDVLLSHDCPAGVAIPGFGPPPGPEPGAEPAPGPRWPEDALRDAHTNRLLLREIVDAVRPTHLFHGHFHTAYTAELPLPGGPAVAVRGLNRDPEPGNVVHLDLAALTRDSAARRQAAAR